MASTVTSIYLLTVLAFTAVQSSPKALTDLSRKLGEMTAHSSRWLLSSAVNLTWGNTARLIDRITFEVDKRIDVGVLAYLLSVPLTVVAVLLLIFKAAGVGTGVEMIPVIVIAIGAGIVLLFTRIRRTRSGNIRRAERAANMLDEDRA